jgi:hypothetical protein
LSRKKRCITNLLQAIIEKQYTIIKAIISKKSAKVKAKKYKIYIKDKAINCFAYAIIKAM